VTEKTETHYEIARQAINAAEESGAAFHLMTDLGDTVKVIALHLDFQIVCNLLNTISDSHPECLQAVILHRAGVAGDA